MQILTNRGGFTILICDLVFYFSTLSHIEKKLYSIGTLRGYSKIENSLYIILFFQFQNSPLLEYVASWFSYKNTILSVHGNKYGKQGDTAALLSEALLYKTRSCKRVKARVS